MAEPNPGKKRRGPREKLSWIFGVGWNAVDDDGSWFKKLLSARRSWSLPFYPSQVSAEIIGKKGWTFGTAFSFNRYKPGKLINGQESPGQFLFFNLDGFAKWHMQPYIKKMSKRYDPYIPMGIGYTLRFIPPYNSVFTFNLGGGINIWLNEIVGLNFQTVGKIGLRGPILKNGSNYLQHSVGFVFLWDRSPKKKHSFIKPRYKWVHDKRKVGERTR